MPDPPSLTSPRGERHGATGLHGALSQRTVSASTGSTTQDARVSSRSRWSSRSLCWATRSSPTRPRTCASRTSPPASASSERTAGFDISQTLIEYSSTIELRPRVLGRLAEHAARRRCSASCSRPCSASRSASRDCRPTGSSRALATVYVETVRNVPLLLQLFVWYFAVLKTLPDAAPEPGCCPAAPSSMCAASTCRRSVLRAGLSGSCVVGLRVSACAGRLRSSRSGRAAASARPGRRSPCCWPALGADRRLAAARASSLAGAPLGFDYPRAAAASTSRAASTIEPEFMALLARARRSTPRAFIAEIVRAGIRACRKGQTEAAEPRPAPGQVLRLVVIPQAMRIIIPPLTSQYLNLTKNSSLAVAIGYPDLVSRVRRHGAEPDRAGGRGDPHHHGRLSRASAC